MSLKNKIILILVLVIIAYLGLVYAIQKFFVLHNFARIEHEEVQKNLKGCVEIIKKEYAHVDTSCYDWARWDDMYNYVLNRNEEFARANLHDSIFEINQLNGFYLIGKDNKVIWGKSYDLVNNRFISINEFPDRIWPSDHPLLQLKGVQDKINGIFITQDGPILVSARPVIKSNNEGPVVATLIMFRFLQGQILDSVEKQANFHIRIFNIRDKLPTNIAEIGNKLFEGVPYYISTEKRDNLIYTYIFLNDIKNKPCLILETGMHLMITDEAKRFMRIGLFAILWGGLIIIAVLSIFLQYFVIKPVEKLNNHIKSIMDSNNLSLRIDSTQKDEVGKLAMEFNGLLEKLDSVINELESAKKDLQENEEYLKNILDSLSTGVILLDKTGKNILDINKYALKLIGMEKEDLLNTPFDTLFARQINLRTNTFESNTQENSIIDSNNRKIPVLFSYVTITEKEDQFIIVSFIDLTEYKRIEDDLLRMQKLESLGILAGGIAHDFNNLLATIMGNVSLAILNIDEKSKLYKMLNNAHTASEKAKDLSHQLLTFSKGGMPVKKTATIDQLIKDSAMFVVIGKNVDCEFDIMENIYPTEIDKSQISQVISNLVINAIQAMPGGGKINISCRNKTITELDSVPLASGEYVEISITDHGSGISEENINKIFDPYFTTKEQGNGLGLATCYSIMKNHNGYIKVESKLDVGSTFRIYLPSSENKPLAEKSNTGQIVKGSGRILIMDDDSMVRETLAAILKALGYESDFASQGSEAIQLYSKTIGTKDKFDLIIIDLTVRGGMGGKDTISELKKIDPNVKAVVSSGYSNDPVIADYKNYGFCGRITKPFNISEINSVISSALNLLKNNI